MNKASKIVVLSVLAAALLVDGGAAAASFSADALRGEGQQQLTQLSTQAGTGDFGSKNGKASAVQFRIPSSIAVKADGSLIVSDSRNHQLRQISGGTVNAFAGLVYKLDAKGFPIGGLLDGEQNLALFNNPQGIAVDAAGNVYVADAGNNAIRKIDTAGNVSTIAGDGIMGSSDGTGKTARFNGPLDVAVAPDGTLYVADTLNHLIRGISPSGQVTTLNAASTRVVEVTPGQASPAGDFADGSLNTAKFNEPSGLAVDAKGNLYVSDSGNQRIRYIDLDARTVTTVAGGTKTVDSKKDLYAAGGYVDGEAAAARFNFPLGLAVTSEGGLVIADSQNHSIRYLLNGQVSTLAGSKNQRIGEQDGIEGYGELQRPSDVAVLADGSITVADGYNNKIRLLRPYRLPADLPNNDEVKVVVEEKAINFEVQPEISEGRTMVPVRAITEALGYKVDYVESSKTVQLSKDGITVELYVDQTGLKRLAVGKEPIIKATDAAPYIKEGSTFVPVRFFAEEIGLDVQWDRTTRTVILRNKTLAQ